MTEKKMTDDALEKLFLEADKKKSSCSDRLQDASYMGGSNDVVKTMEWLALNFKEAGGSVSFIDPGAISRAPAVLSAVYRSSPGKQTLLVYGFFTRGDGDGGARGEGGGDAGSNGLYGNKITSTGALLSWIDAIRLCKSNRIQLPLNVRFIVACIDNTCGQELFQFFKDKKHIIYKDVHYVCLPYSDVMLNSRPSIVYGFRGCCKFCVTVKCLGQDLHRSGDHSGMIQEAMTDVVALLNSLVNSKGEVLIPNIREGMREVTDEEEEECRNKVFDVAALKKQTQCTSLLHKGNGKRLVMHSTRFPSVSIHAVDTSKQRSDDVIPAKVCGRFTVWLVPDQNASAVSKRVNYHLKEVFAKIKSRNSLSVHQTEAVDPLLWDHKGPNFQAARESVGRVLKQNVECVRQGTCYPVLSDLQTVFAKDILLLPVGYYEAGQGKEGNIKTYIDGIKIVLSYLYELSKIK